MDAVGNVSCYTYDGLHRKTSANYPSGSYASVTPAKTFVYDSTTFSCASPPNYPAGAYVAGRLAEAFTGPSTAKITDIGYCYSPRGEISDVFESTPNSGGYYHTTGYYWANGTLNSLGGVPGLSSWTFKPDGEGRPYSATYGASTNWVTSATYYPSNASNPPSNNVTFGSGDSDAYGVDATTGRMNGFQFTVGKTPQTLSGTVGWNPDWTLGSLGITDPFNSSNTQNCSYVYDDLARANSVNCIDGSTTVWNQSFTTDPFGNLNKSGSITFDAQYVLTNGTTNNQEQSVASCVPTYDADGNMTKDCSFSTPPTYAWDSDGNPITLRSSHVTFDALDREVELKNGTTITQILYSPIGKLGTMNGQTVKAARIPLPGGSTAEMATASDTYILHADWLGSSRLTTNYSTRAMTYDTAYAPFGEAYSSTSTSTTYLDFTGQFQDTMVGLDDFLYREYDPVQGRWIKPDPAGLAVANPANPQTWNRYAYVGDNPLNAVDALGLQYNGYAGAGTWDWWNNEGQLCDPTGQECAPGMPSRALKPTLGQGTDLALSELQGAEAYYQGQVDCGFNPGSCPNGVPGSPGYTPPSGQDSAYTIWVRCGGSLTDVTCLAPSQATSGGSFSFNLLYPGLAPGDVPVGTDFLHCAGCPSYANAEAFIEAFAATSVIVGTGGYVFYDFFQGAAGSNLFSTGYQSGSAGVLNGGAPWGSIIRLGGTFDAASGTLYFGLHGGEGADTWHWDWFEWWP